MPTYDYECTVCKHRFEVFQSMKDDPIEKCVKCGGKVKKLIGAGAGIIFKGSGFYVNDYKKASPATNGTASSSSKSTSESATKATTKSSNSSNNASDSLSN